MSVPDHLVDPDPEYPCIACAKIAARAAVHSHMDAMADDLDVPAAMQAEIMAAAATLADSAADAAEDDLRGSRTQPCYDHRTEQLENED